MPALSVCVLAGGDSPERHVSLASGANVAAHLRRAGHRAVVLDLCPPHGPLSAAAEAAILAAPIAPPPDAGALAVLRAGRQAGDWLSRPELRHADVVFPLVHGFFGEDGRLQALLDAAGLPYVGSDWVGQALAMDKHLAKQLLAQNGIRTPAWQCLAAGTIAAPRGLALPAVVMPANGGSSVATTICQQPEELAPALARAWGEDRWALVQEFIAGRELTVGVLDGEALALGEIRAPGARFDYEAKYRGAATREIFPAEVAPAIGAEAGRMALQMMAALRLRHYARMDFILDAQGRLWALEANAVPGMTAKSLYPQSAAAAGLEFGRACERLCRIALGERGQGARGQG